MKLTSECGEERTSQEGSTDKVQSSSIRNAAASQNRTQGSFTKHRSSPVLRMESISCRGPSLNYHKVVLIPWSSCDPRLQTSSVVSPFVLQNSFSRRTSRSSSCWKRRRWFSGTWPSAALPCPRTAPQRTAQEYSSAPTQRRLSKEDH